MKRKMASVLGSIAMVTVMASVSLASAATHHVSGGVWDHGTTGLFGDGTVYSNYFHASKVHGSSVKNANGKTAKSGDVAKGKTSYASTNAVAFKTDYAYYYTK